VGLVAFPYSLKMGSCQIQEDQLSILEWGSKGSENGKFEIPHSIAFDLLGNVYVTDTDNDRVQKFTSNGTFITKWGTEGSRDGQFLKPEGIDIDSLNNIYVADTGNSRIQKFTSNSTFITKWGTAKSSNSL